MPAPRLIVNNDFYNIFQLNPPVTAQDIHDAVDKLAGTQVDQLTFDVPPWVQESSALAPELADLYAHPATDTCLANLRAVRAAGQDPYAMLLARTQAHGLPFLASLRMNDTHYKDQPCHPFVEGFYYDHLGDRVGQPQGRRHTEYDYRKSAVRAHYLGIIERTLASYEVAGVELNFTRNPTCFPQPYADECAPVMTQFISEVRRLLDQVGTRRGVRLELAILVPFGLLRCRQAGLDLATWARLGLVDQVGFLSGFLASFDHDFRDLRRALPGVRLYGGCDRNLAWETGGGRVVPMPTYRAMAQAYWNQGADGIYLFNVMVWTMNHAKANSAVKRDGGHGETRDAAVDYDRHLLHELGDPATLAGRDKLYLLTSGEASPERPNPPLPVAVPAGGEVTVRLFIGDDVAAAAKAGTLARLVLQTVSSDCADYNQYTLLCNGCDLARLYAFTPYAETPADVLLFAEPGRLGALPPAARVRRHALRPVDLHQGVNYLTIKSHKDALIISELALAIYYRQA